MRSTANVYPGSLGQQVTVISNWVTLLPGIFYAFLSRTAILREIPVLISMLAITHGLLQGRRGTGAIFLRFPSSTSLSRAKRLVMAVDKSDSDVFPSPFTSTLLQMAARPPLDVTVQPTASQPPVQRGCAAPASWMPF
ncbi:hypothetical protein Aduo_010426 [Ancylostoma duodenale]